MPCSRGNEAAKTRGGSSRVFDTLITWESMEESAGELGTIYALMARFEKQRLPRLLELKRVDGGGVPSEPDSKFMFQVTLDARRSKRLIDTRNGISFAPR